MLASLRASSRRDSVSAVATRMTSTSVGFELMKGMRFSISFSVLRIEVSMPMAKRR